MKPFIFQVGPELQHPRGYPGVISKFDSPTETPPGGLDVQPAALVARRLTKDLVLDRAKKGKMFQVIA